jgi:hypothetical protein
MVKPKKQIFRAFLTLLFMAGLASAFAHKVHDASCVSHHSESCSQCIALHSLTTVSEASSYLILPILLFLTVEKLLTEQNIYVILNRWQIHSALDPPVFN